MGQDDWIDLNQVWEMFIEQDSGRLERLPTGLPSLDAALDGGLPPGLIVLGGIPGVGKSTLALQIAIHSAEKGQPVLYFSLEMPAGYILFKTVSQKARQSDPSLDITANGLLNGWLEPDKRKKLKDIKPDALFQNLHICTKPLSAADISKQIETFQENYPGKMPLVIIDYLQILRPMPQGKYASSDRQVVEGNLNCLMDLAHGPLDAGAGSGLPVLLISSLNRSSYRGEMEIGAFKETGGIEYSADLLLGLQFRACGKDGFDLKTEQKKSPREVEILILKNRYGSSGDTVPFQYDPRHDCFFPPEERSGKADTFKPKEGAPVREAAVLPAGATVLAPAVADPEGSTGSAEPTFRCIINNTKAANEIRRGRAKDTDQACEVSRDSGGRLVVIRYSLSAPLSGLDLCVADAIYTVSQSLERKPEQELSLRAVLYALSGSKHTALTPSMRQFLYETIQRLRGTELHLDCTDDLRERTRRKEGSWDENLSWDYRGPFLAVEKSGRDGVYCPAPVAERFGILPLHTYGKEIDQLLNLSSRYLNIQKGDGSLLVNTSDNICLKRFFAHRMEVIRYCQEKQKEMKSLKIISFQDGSSLLAELRISSRDRNYKQRVQRLYRSAIVILEYYRKIGYVEKYEASPGSREVPPRIEITGRVSRQQW